jgi:hypothetical protein
MKDRILGKITREGECWIWQGSKSESGYGRINIRPRIQRAHRVSYEVFVGPIPDGAEIMHSCDNPACVNPEHLSPGTHRQNMEDAASKGRMARLKGQENPSASLCDSQVAYIFSDPSKHKRGYISRMARLYDVSRTTIRDILTRRKWSHITNSL